MIADSAARARAIDTASSFIVQAPAGSGKTELLIQRYLKLLAIVDSPEGVVAITFTRKAAGEMRSRVIEALRKADSGQIPASEHEQQTFQIAADVLEHSRGLGWNLPRNPAQMRIETIDALCAAITRRMPWLSRFGAMPEISEKADDLYREAARNTLRHVEREHQAVADLLLHLDNDFYAAERLIVQMLERRDQWLRHTGANPDFKAVRIELERSLQRLIVDELRKLRGGFDSDTASELALLRELDRFPDARIEDLERWKCIVDLLLTGGGDWRRRVDKTVGYPPRHPLKGRCEQLLARLQGNDDLLGSVRRFRELPAPWFSDKQWQALEAAVSVLTLAVAELEMVFRDRHRVDFAELSIRASEALGKVESPTELALALGYRTQHILVDEFQDTSYSQFELLQKLTAGWEPADGRTLFLVGDPMQSIYRFRQADVSLFLKARADGIGSIRLEPLTLGVNFRSQPEIVAWVNETFTRVLPEEDDIEAGAVAYSSSVAGRAGGDGRIEVHACADGVDEATRVIEILRNSGDKKIAVLVRARAHLPLIVTALKRAGIRFQAVEIDQLGERAVVEDLMALTLALLHAADRVSWLAILRAPWCGLKLEDLDALASDHHGATIWDLLHRPDRRLSEDGAARVARILPVLEQALAERGRRTLRDWVESVWLRLGGPACVDETGLKDAAAYFDLLEGLQEGADLADFGWLREQVNLLFAQPDAEAGDRLQLMTIHKAKGLEFDIVILPGLGVPPRSEDQRLLLWLEQRGEMFLAPVSESGRDTDPIYNYLRLLERRKTEHETARMLYVAATRARQNLHLMGAVRTTEDGSMVEPAGGSFLRLLWPAVSYAFGGVVPAGSANVARESPIMRRVAAGWNVPSPPDFVTWSRAEVKVMQPPQVTFEWVGDVLRHTGTALHGFLQRVAREGLEKWDENAIRSRRGLYRAVLRNLGVPPGELPDAAAHVEAGLVRTLRDPRGRWILESHPNAQCEWPIAGLIDGQLYETTIDRTFIDEDGVRWIIDYKTSEHRGGDVEAFLENERTRYQDLLERYARLVAPREQRPIRLGLYFPLLSGWREWGAAVVLRKQATLFEL